MRALKYYDSEEVTTLQTKLGSLLEGNHKPATPRPFVNSIVYVALRKHLDNLSAILPFMSAFALQDLNKWLDKHNDRMPPELQEVLGKIAVKLTPYFNCLDDTTEIAQHIRQAKGISESWHRRGKS